MKCTAPVLTCVLILGTGGCGSKTESVEDSSPSGAVASAVGSALSNTMTSGTLASRKKFEWISSAFAADTCPTFKTTATGCTASGSTLWLTYSSCSFTGSSATWKGVQAITESTGTAACGTFPNPGALGTLIRQFVSATSSTAPSTATHVSSFGTTSTVDHSTANLGNFDSETIATIANNGYGSKVTFNGSGTRSSLVISERHYSSGNFDLSLSGTLAITETAGATSRTLSGSIVTYHNLLKVIATSTFTGITHSDSCCFPTAGTISTNLTEGKRVSPTTIGSKLIGKTETLTITGCGTATLVGFEGAISNVTFSRCY